MTLDTTDPAFIETLAKACAATPLQSIIANALRDVIHAERQACAKVAHDRKIVCRKLGLGKQEGEADFIEHRIRDRGGK